MRILLIASAVGPLGDGATGGVSDAVRNTASELARHGHHIDILAAEGSSYQGPAHLIGISGQYQPTIFTGINASPIYPIIQSSLIAHYCNYAYAHREEYDVILNFCHDWLPYYLTPFFNIPLLHQANVCDENTVVTEQIQNIASIFYQHVGVLSYAQAIALGIEGKAFVCGFGIDMALYHFNPSPERGTLIWCARIAKEKGLEDAAKIAWESGKKLVVCGYMQDIQYFEHVMNRHGDIIEYRGFLNKTDLVNEMGRAEALLSTPKCVEAFGVVVVEALACGTPVIAFDCGGPAEIIQHGKTGFLSVAGDISQAVECVAKLPLISREHCRKVCEENYSLASYGNRMNTWLTSAR